MQSGKSVQGSMEGGVFPEKVWLPGTGDHSIWAIY